MKQFLIMLGVALAINSAWAADLNIQSQSNKTYDGGTYNKLVINNSSGITVKNCKFSAGSGFVGEVKGGSKNILVEACEFNGTENACTGIRVNGSTAGKVTFKNNLIQNIADDGVVASGHNIHFIGNTMRNLISKGTDGRISGPCYNGHSDGFELTNCHNSVFDGNLIYDIKGTSAFYFGSYSDKCTNIRVVNNLMYTPECGFVVYIKDVTGVDFCNNTIWKGDKGGVALGSGITDLEMYNNILHSINTKHMSFTLNPATHKIDYNLVGLANQGMPLQPNDVWAVNCLFQRIPAVVGGTILYDVKPEDFKLQAGSPAIGKGTSGGVIPTADFYGTARSTPYDLGAIQSASTAIKEMEPVRIPVNPISPADNLIRYSLTGHPVSEGNSGIYLVKDGDAVRKTMVLK